MSELEQLETRHAPCMTKIQCEKRCLALQATIDSGWEFIRFISKLDSAMRLALFNYLHAEPSTNTLDNAAYITKSDLPSNLSSDLSTLEDQTGDNAKQTKTLSPKKRSQKTGSKKRVIA